MQRYYVNQASAVIIGQPSANLADKLEKTEKARIAEQIKTLGPEGLKRAEAVLEEAKAEHSKQIPIEMLTSFPVPDVKSISWIPVQSVQEPGKGRSAPYPPSVKEPLYEHIQSDGQELPFFVEYDHVTVRVFFFFFGIHYCKRLTPRFQSDFVTVHALFSLADLPDRLRP